MISNKDHILSVFWVFVIEREHNTANCLLNVINYQNSDLDKDCFLFNFDLMIV